MGRPPVRKAASARDELVLDVPATAAGLRSSLERITRACAGTKLPRDTAWRLQIVVEELFSNTIKYGYGGESEQPVHLHLRLSPRISLVYQDAAPPFDPTAWRETVPPAKAREQLGHRGIALVLGLAESARYRRLAGGNRLTLRFAGAPSGRAAPPGRGRRA
jgi:serine/threonine-protein kinase RsbW